MNGWIDSKELPKQRGRYLVWWEHHWEGSSLRRQRAIMSFDPDREPELCVWVYECDDRSGCSKSSADFESVPLADVLFWMPLPGPPAGKKEIGCA